MFTKRIKGIEPSGIRRILELASQVTDPIDMSIGQPDFDVPDHIKKACVNSIQAGFNRYTSSLGIPELRQKLLSHLHTRNLIVEDLLITPGAAGAITLFFLALVEEGDEVVLTDPYFLNYRHMITLTQAVPRFLDTYPDFRIRPEEVDRLIGPSTKMIVLNSPGNPTGTLHSEEEIQLVVEAARKHDCWILSDEVYHDFVYDDVPFVSPAQFYEKTLIVDCFSKSCGMPGWRLGYGTAPKEVVAEITPLQQYLYSCAPAPIQKAGVLCVGRDVSSDRERMQKKRDLLYEGIKDYYQVAKPGGAFYLFPEAPGGDCYPFIEKALEKNLFLSPGDTFSRRSSNFRISYAIPNDNLVRGIEILRSLASNT